MGLTGQTLSTLRYGYQRGSRTMIADCPIGNNEVFTDTGAKFVVQDAAGYCNTAESDTDADLYGWMEVAPGTYSTTADGDNSASVDTSCQSVYYIPANATVDITMRNKTCDIVIDTNRQRANVGTSSTNALVIEEVDIVNTAVWVRMNENVRHATGV